MNIYNVLDEIKCVIMRYFYIFAENYDSYGNPVWRCECHVDSQENYWWGEYSSKKQGKKAVAYDMLCDLLDWEDDDEA